MYDLQLPFGYPAGPVERVLSKVVMFAGQYGFRVSSGLLHFENKSHAMQDSNISTVFLRLYYSKRGASMSMCLPTVISNLNIILA